ncbi:MAG TPA: Hsp20 family protein [Blastocatellia bacterium]|nr:Hsp20 family protein [Blastocatellia bacterium]
MAKAVAIHPMTSSVQETVDRLREQIAVRAHQLAVERGYEPGHELDDWLRAESQLVWKPEMHLEEHPHTLVVKFRVPGIPREDIHVWVDRRSLVLLGEAQPEGTAEDVRIHGSEFRYGQIYRQLDLPIPVEPERGRARLSDGVLTITLPKQAWVVEDSKERRSARRKKSARTST